MYAWVEFAIQGGILRNGRNQISVALHSRPDGLVAKVVWEAAELAVTYPGPVANTAFDRLAALNHG